MFGTPTSPGKELGLIYMYILSSRRSPKIPDAAPRNVSSDPGPTLPLAKMNDAAVAQAHPGGTRSWTGWIPY